MESPAFTAIGIPALRCIVATPRRQSLPSSMSSWTRNALCSISRPAAAGSASSARPPSALAVAMHRAGRRPLPDRSKKIAHEPVKVALGLRGRNALRERVAEHVAVPAQALEKARRPEDIACARQRLGDLRCPRLVRGQSANRRISTGSPAPSSRTLGRARSAQLERARDGVHERRDTVQAEGAPVRGAATRRGWRGLRPARAKSSQGRPAWYRAASYSRQGWRISGSCSGHNSQRLPAKSTASSNPLTARRAASLAPSIVARSVYVRT